jgi:rRNA-processing protein EBP2
MSEEESFDEVTNFDEEDNDEVENDASGEENDEDEEDNENVIDISKLLPPKKVFKNNTTAILQKLKEIEVKNLPWIENMTISLNVVDNSEVDPQDDFQRELAYYRQSLAAVKEAQIKFEALGVKYHRPDDYFAEMLKSDTHMAKVCFNFSSSFTPISSTIRNRF